MGRNGTCCRRMQGGSKGNPGQRPGSRRIDLFLTDSGRGREEKHRNNEARDEGSVRIFPARARLLSASPSFQSGAGNGQRLVTKYLRQIRGLRIFVTACHNRVSQERPP